MEISTSTHTYAYIRSVSLENPDNTHYLAKKDFADVIKLRMLRWRGSFWIFPGGPGAITSNFIKEGREGRDAVTGQGRPAATGIWKQQEIDSPLEPLEGPGPR